MLRSFHHNSIMGMRFTVLYLVLGTLILIVLWLQYNNKTDEIHETGNIHEAKPMVFTFKKYEKNDNLQKWNKLLPRSKHCSKNLNKHLTDIRESQRERVDYWWNVNIKDDMKWVSLTSVYAPDLISYSALYRFKSDGETKYFLDFLKPPEKCNVWTFGVGLDYRGETGLHERYPQCEMTAVDPMSEINKQLVEEVKGARFIQATIGANDGNYTARLSGTDHRYRTTTVKHNAITPFIQKHNGNKTIDLFLIDIEGAEFGVLPKLIDDMDKLPTICQLNVELHYPPESFGYTNAEAFANIHKFLANETYSVFNIEIIRRFIRLYAVNTKSPQCLKKFFC